MISTDSQRVQVQDVVGTQLPSFVRDDFPLVVEFLKEYYVSQEYPGASVDLLNNIDQYVNLTTLTSNTNTTETSSAVSIGDDTISVSYNIREGILGTYQFPDRNGLIQIDDEVILYREKTTTSFLGCVRGFSGVTSYKSSTPDKLTFTDSVVAQHDKGSTVKNLSALILNEFLLKFKRQFAPGFDERTLAPEVNEKLFVSEVNSFYKAKGTDNSFKILFKALFGETVEVLRPSENLFKPSDANYKITKDVVADLISIDGTDVDSSERTPLDLKNQTLFQDGYGNVTIGTDKTAKYDIENASATISDVEKVFEGGKEYWKLSLGFGYSRDTPVDGTIFGDFTIHPKTRNLNSVSAGATAIDVDSTLGFPESGELAVVYDSGDAGIVSYTSRTVNQFLSVDGVSQELTRNSDLRLNVSAYAYVGIGTTTRIDLRIGGVLDEVKITSPKTYNFTDEDVARISSLGITTDVPTSYSWIYNIAPSFEVESAVQINSDNITYRITTTVPNDFINGTRLLFDSNGQQFEANVSSVSNDRTFTAVTGRLITVNSVTVQRVATRAFIDPNYSSQSGGAENTLTDVSNVYVTSDGKSLVAASSIPYYASNPLQTNKRQSILNGAYSGDTFTIPQHGYYSGDALYYEKSRTSTTVEGVKVETVNGFDNLFERIYYVKRVNDNQIKLATSQSNLYNNNFVSVDGTVTNNKLYPSEFQGKELNNQRLLRKFETPDEESGTYPTQPGAKIGMLINGVEILNYKANQYCYYGTLDGVDVSNPGSDYDVINPPLLVINDAVGTGATGVTAVRGNLDSIQIIDSGFDYVEEPIITITGGNGRGAVAKANTIFIDYAASVNAENPNRIAIGGSDTVGFTTFHKFRNAEQIIYKPDGQTGIVGLVTDAKYYVQTVDAFTIKLFKNEGDAITGSNAIGLTGLGKGTHRFQSVNKKRIISNIFVEDSGEGYENKERKIGTVGILTASNYINIENHGYSSGERVRYSSTGDVAEPLAADTSYIVTKVDNDNFALSSVGLGTTGANFYYDTNQYIDIATQGSGVHSFNYEPITVAVTGKIGVTTFAGQDSSTFNAVIQPLFRGTLESVQLTSNGVGYGSSDIIGFDRQPRISVFSGHEAELLPVVSNGRIQEVLVVKSGSGYNSAPHLKVSGLGKDAILTPVLLNGAIDRVVIQNAGVDYTEDTTVAVIPSGTGSVFNSKIQTWNVNLFQKYFDNITEDDGILEPGLNSDYGIQYTHVYAPRSLRESVFSKSAGNNTEFGTPDLLKLNGLEQTSENHSPILGWAYDGNPIYGPFAYNTTTGGSIKEMKSGYERITRANRPAAFPLGFFVEDFEYKGTGDLDEHNGRFCVTPDYPNGTYAYFATIGIVIDGSGPFRNYRPPQFPYLIGNSFNNKPNQFNFEFDSNQDVFDLNNSEYFRNVTPYKMNSSGVDYKYLLQPNKVKSPSITINDTRKGSIETVGILTGGKGYQVGDKIVFESVLENIPVIPARARVGRVLGKPVSTVSVASSIIDNLEVVPNGKNYVAFSTAPNLFSTREVVTVAGLSTATSTISGVHRVGVNSSFFKLINAVSDSDSTGIVTFFNISGEILDDKFNIRENDIFAVGAENVRILNIDSLSSRVRVLRSVNGTVSAAHTATTSVIERSRKFSFTPTQVENKVTFNLNKEYYFNPLEALGIGTESGVGVGVTLSFANPGAGKTQLFIQTRAIYLPNHQLQTGDILKYNTYDGDSIGVSTVGAANTFPLPEFVYVARISNDLIGISTVQVGLGATGTFAGIAATTANDGTLYFAGIGTGVYHSFTTQKQNVVTAEAYKNVVTVSTGETHGLSVGDNAFVDLSAGVTTSITVKYDDANRRLVFNPKAFVAGNVNIVENSITLTSHGLSTGDKVIHTASTASGGLVDGKIYYVFKNSNDTIKLCLTRHDAQKFNPTFIDITSASAGTLSPINPPLSVYKNDTVEFDLTDSSLSFDSSGTSYPAFNFHLFSDANCTNKFVSTKVDSSFEVSSTGTIGVSTDAKVTLRVTDTLPEKLYYKASPSSENFLPAVKSEIINDLDVSGHNQIQVNDSVYSGAYQITGVTTNTFTYNTNSIPERTSYSTTDSKAKYETDSTNAYGAISKVDFQFNGSGYPYLVGIATIVGVSTNPDRSGAILLPDSTDIGNIVTTTVDDIGFDYSADNTLRPTLNLPEVLFVDPLVSFDRIGITSAGKNYTIPPKLNVLDGLTGNLITDTIIEYDIGDTVVRIPKNTKGMSDVTPTIIPTNNVNGIAVGSISYDISSKNVTVGLATAFSDSAPLSVGDKVLIEGVSVGVGSTGNGYNSRNYGYKLFTLTDVNIPLGGAVGVVTYSMVGDLDEGKIAGNFDSLNSVARIVPEKFFPQFDIRLKRNNFLIGEEVTSGTKVGVVENWNNQLDLLKVDSKFNFNVGDRIVGSSSKAQSVVREKSDFIAEATVASSAVVNKGWSRETGFLSYNTERLSDNNYYQNLSYSLKSKVSLEDWDDAVSSLAHPAGLVKFSDHIVESIDEDFRGVFTKTSGSTIDIISDLVSVSSLNCYNDFDLVSENALNIDGEITSTEINFQSRVLTNYFESIGNRVLTIDDISTQFSNTPLPNRFAIVGAFNALQKTNKFLTFVQDSRFTDERQTMIVNVLSDGITNHINQYGRVETTYDMGTFDIQTQGTEGKLQFFPTKFSINNFNVSSVNIGINNAVASIGSTMLGNIADIQTFRQTSSGISTEIVSFATTYRSAKLMVEIDTFNGEMEFDEINLIHDGTTVDIVEYGSLTNQGQGTFVPSGFGTYSASISGSNVSLVLNSTVGAAYTVTSLGILMADDTATGVGNTLIIGNAFESEGILDTHFTSLSSSATPGIHTIATYNHDLPNRFSAAYYVISIEDTTNNAYQISECIVTNNSTDAYISEYGTIATNVGGIGTIGVLLTSADTFLQYTPPASADVEVRVLQLGIGPVAGIDDGTSVDLNNGSITGSFGNYSGTNVTIKRAFDLKHGGKTIFSREFNPTETDIIDLENNTVLLPEHFFVTGEEIVYDFPETAGAEGVGIATTTFSGIGATSALPRNNISMFAVKVDSKHIKVARTAEDALKSTPVVIDLTSVGVGTGHNFIAKNQNTKCLVALDNMIQSPVTKTTVTSGLTTSIQLTDVIIKMSGISSFFGGDLIQIDNEIMKINTVGIGSTNFVLVERPWMGTEVAIHTEGASVTRVSGSYNIVDNTINFYTAPQGPTPISSTTNAPDSRDFTGITTFSTFQGRAFLRSGTEGGSDRTYNTNYIFDDISEDFDATTKTFTLKSNGDNVVGFKTDNAVILINNIFQSPTGDLTTNQDYTLTEGSGISSVTFTGTATSLASDPNNASIPVGGIIVSVGSTGGFGYQPLVAAGGTAIVSSAGTITSISIGSSGSGYRVGIQTVVNVGVQTSSTGKPNIQFIGTAAVANGQVVSVAVTTGGSGFSQGSEPIVVFDQPLSYSGIALTYAAGTSGFGTEATVDVIVGQGSSVIGFEIRNTGYGYGQGETLTIGTGGTTGIPLVSGSTLEEFQITIDRVQSDSFNAWHFGELQVLDLVHDQFDGIKRSFTLKTNGSPVTIRATAGSQVDTQATLLVFLNDILQVPGDGYSFDGGSTITFASAPRGRSADGYFGGDKCKILFYKGTGSVDVKFREVLQTVKDGDTVVIKRGSAEQSERLVDEVVSTDQISTEAYVGFGIDGNPDNKRSLQWCKQTEDKIVGGKVVSKARVPNSGNIFPTTHIIQSVGVGSTNAYVESVSTFFNPANENTTSAKTQTIDLTSQDVIVGAAATAVVSAAGTISSIVIGVGGTGYTSAPAVTIANPVGLGTTARATATATLTGDTVSAITVSTPGVAYTSATPPVVLIENPQTISEENISSQYLGDFGEIVGVTSTSVGVASTGFVFDFFIPIDSALRDTNLVGAAVTVSGINAGDYFVVNSSNVGSGVTSLYQNGATLGVTTQFLDSVYEVAAVSTATTAVAGVGITYVRRVTVSVEDLGDITGIGLTEFYGNYSWGRIDLGTRVSAQAFNAYTLNGSAGVSTSAVVTRLSPLKIQNYS